MKVPDGWALVPIEPTPAMATVMREKLENGPPTHRWHWIWHELLEAAPDHPDAELEVLPLTSEQFECIGREAVRLLYEKQQILREANELRKK